MAAPPKSAKEALSQSFVTIRREGMEKNFGEVIQRMAREQGKEVLLNGKAKVYLTDYCEGQFKKEANIFRQILDANCGELINNADNMPERKQKLMERLEEDNGLSPKVTAEYLDLLGLILKGDTSKCGEASLLSAEEKTAEAKAKAEQEAMEIEAKVKAEQRAREAKAAALTLVKGKITLKDGSVYEGDLVNDKPHGKGKRTWPDREKGTGDYMPSYDFKNKKSTIKEKMKTIKGNVYEGDFVNGEANGKGKMTYPDGIYEGDFVNGKSHGKGKMTYFNGDVCEGDFANGEANGKGKMTDSHGNIYEGDFVNGKPHGKGKKTYFYGDVYEGDFVNGIFHHGKGRTCSDGNVYEGDFVYYPYHCDNDSCYGTLFHGKGKFTFANGDVYEGDFDRGRSTGKGKFTFADGHVYENYGKSRCKGKSVFYDRSVNNGSVYEGDLLKGIPHGKGKVTSRGNVYEGTFKNGERHGKGKETRDGIIHEQIWKNGRKLKEKTTGSSAYIVEGKRSKFPRWRF